MVRPFLHRRLAGVIVWGSLCALAAAQEISRKKTGEPVYLEPDAGTHWASADDFPQFRQLGYRFVMVTIDPDPETWAPVLDAAEANGLQLIAGLWPPPYKLVQGAWEISLEGRAFLRYAASRPGVVKAIYGYNEPYWVDPFTMRDNICGALSAAQLRALRSAIREVWPEAAVFHDVGNPSVWAPGGWLHAANPCIGNKYADAAGVADFVGIWFFPFDQGTYRREEGLGMLRREIQYVTYRMGAQPIVSAQAFQCLHCGEATRMPTDGELRDWNCSLRELQPHAISWYPWRQDFYNDYLSNHPEYWDATRPSVCGTRAGPRL